MSYDAFISYSHSTDGELAPAIQSALHRFAKPFYRLRAVRVFRDVASLSATPKLWSKIEQALAESRYFIVLASPSAAKSRWVSDEIEYWLKHKSPDSLLLVVTEGDIEWSVEKKDFLWPVSTALPVQLKEAFTEEPLYIDLRGVNSDPIPLKENARFVNAIADISSTIRGIDKDTLIGEDVSQQRRTRRWMGGAIFTLLILLAVSLMFAEEATVQRDASLVRSLSATSQVLLSQRGDLIETAALLAVEAVKRSPTLDTDASTNRKFISFLPASFGLRLSNYLDAGEVSSLEADQAIRKSISLLPNRIAEMKCAEGGELTLAAANQDDGLLATSSMNRRIQIWDLIAGNLITDLAADNVRKMQFRPRGKQLLALTDENTTIFDYVNDDKKGAELGIGNRVSDAIYDPSGQFIVTTGMDQTTRIFDADTLEEFARMENSRVMQFVKATPEVSEVITWNNQVAEIFRSPGVPSLTIDLPGAAGTKFEYSEDGKYLAQLSSGQFTLSLSDVRSHSQLLYDSQAWNVSFSKNSKRFAFASPEWFAQAYDLPSCWIAGQYYEPTSGMTFMRKDVYGRVSCKSFPSVRHDNSINTVTLSYDGAFMATTSRDLTVRVWDVADGLEKLRLLESVEGNPSQLMFSQDGKYLSAWGKDFCRTWESSGYFDTHHFLHPDQIFYADFSMDSRRLATVWYHVLYGGEASVWDVESGEKLFTTNAVNSALLSRDGQRLLVDNKEIFFLNKEESEAIELVPREGEKIFAVNLVENITVQADEEGHLLVRDITSGEEKNRISLPETKFQSARMSDDGCCMIAKFEGGWIYWNWVDNRSEEINFIEPVNQFVLSEEGKYYAVVLDSDRNVIQVRNTLTGEAVSELRVESQVNDLHFHPSGQFLITGDDDKWAKVWHLDSERVVAQLRHDDVVWAVRFSPDGRHVVSGGGRSDRLVRMWLWKSHDLAELACQRLSRNLTREEWEQYIGSEPYQQTCGEKGS